MSSQRRPKPSRNIPEHIKRAVNARDNFRCRNCGVATEFIHYDHVFPFDLGGPTTVENIQSLCPKCNTSKGNKVTCRHCGHWMSPDNSKCPQCGTKLPYSKRSRTLAGKLEILFERVGRAVVVGGAALVLLLFIVGAFYVYRAVGGNDDSESAATVSQVVNTSFDVAPGRPTSFRIPVPSGARNARVVGGFKVTSGAKVSCYVLNEEQMARMGSGPSNFPSLTRREHTGSARLRQVLQPGDNYLVFSAESGPAAVAAEFYLKHD